MNGRQAGGRGTAGTKAGGTPEPESGRDGAGGERVRQ